MHGMSRGVKLLLAVLLLPGAPPALAHHSFGAIYDQGKDQALIGVVKEFLFVHPHPVLVIEVRSTDGSVAAWRAEMDNRWELEEIGVTATTFRPGETVEVNGSPGRRQANILYLWKLRRPADGLRYEQVGSSPHLHVDTRR
jgi:hypothetical protein